MRRISGSVIMKAMVDLRRAKRRRPPCLRTATRSTGITAATGYERVSGPLIPLELRGGPVDGLGDRVAARGAAGDHLGHDGLRVHLLRDARGRRRARDPGGLVLARRIVIHGADRRLDLFPDLEVAHALERG